MADKEPKAALPVPEKEPAPVLIVAEQPPIPVVITAPDGVTPVPIPSLGIEANTSPGASAPVPGYVPDGALPATPPTAAIGTPVNMTVMAPAAMPHTVTKGEGVTLAPTTTEQEDTVTAGQRDINKIWERTQSYIAMGVTASTIAIIGLTVIIALITRNEITQAMATQINYLVVMTTLILSFYFSRTNHAAIGGVGRKPVEPPYTGR